MRKERSLRLFFEIAAVLCAVSGIAYLSSRIFLRLDLSEQKQYSLSPVTRKVLDSFSGNITIELYASGNLPPGNAAAARDAGDILREFKAYGKGKLQISFPNLSNERIKANACSLGISEVSLRGRGKDKVELRKCLLGIVVYYNKKKETIPFFFDSRNIEYDLTRSILKVTRRDLPAVGIVLTDSSTINPWTDVLDLDKKNSPFRHLDDSAAIDQSNAFKAKFKLLFDALKNDYRLSIIDLSKINSIDTMYDAVIVPGGKRNTFTDRSLFAIDRFLVDGGNLIVLADAMAIDFAYFKAAENQTTRMLDLLEFYGVRVDTTLVLDAMCGKVPLPVTGDYRAVPVPYPYYVMATKFNCNPDYPAVSKLSKLLFPWTSPCILLPERAGEERGTKADVLIRSSPKSWLAAKHRPLMLDPKLMEKVPSPEDLRESNLAVYISGKFRSYFAEKTMGQTTPDDSAKTNFRMAQSANSPQAPSAVRNGNLVVVGGSLFLTPNLGIASNKDFILNILDWLANKENSLIDLRSRTLTNRPLNLDMISRDGEKQWAVVRYANIILMPALLAIFGAGIFAKRRFAEGRKMGARK